MSAPPPTKSLKAKSRAAGGPLREAYLALDRGNWTEAHQKFKAALAHQESAEAFEGLGKAAWWLEDAETLFRARESAYRIYRRDGDRRSAARMAIALAADSLAFRNEPAVTQGWHRRAHGLLKSLPLAPEHGWLRLGEGDFCLSVLGDPAATQSHAAAATEIGQSLGLEEIHMLARALEGAALVVQGRWMEGMCQLDEAVTAALSGDLQDHVAIGYSCCYMLSACERARDFDRALQWCGRVHAYCRQTRFNALLGVCRTHYASVLIGRGNWSEAEAELEIAARYLSRSRPGLRGEAVVRLAGLRRRQGRFQAAESLLAELAGHHLTLLEQSALELDRENPRRALQLADRFLRRIPQGNQADRFAGLELCLRAQLAQGDRKSAARTLAELRLAGSGQAVGTITASLHLAEGLLAAASGDHELARRCFEDAVDRFDQCKAWFDAARSRLALAQALHSLGQRDLALAEVRKASAKLQELDAQVEIRRAEALQHELVAPPPAAGQSGPGSLTHREVEVLRLVAQGLSNRQIAAHLNLSPFTVKRHLQNILTKLELPSRAAAATYAARHGLL
ncbi:MAG: LuxR C-terminal-related transcriptional regulator [Acidobacteriota bacterium]